MSVVQMAARLEDPSTHGAAATGAVAGGIGGAVAGAVIGACVGGPVGAVVGAVVGAAAGAIIGFIVGGLEGKITSGFPPVLIGGKPAARNTDMNSCPIPWFTHGSTPIKTGSESVHVGIRMQSRVKSMITCGSKVKMGCESVFIGGFIASGNVAQVAHFYAELAAGRTSGDTQQSYQNCGIESSRLLILANGGNVDEDPAIQWALANGHATQKPTLADSGGTVYGQRQQILAHYGVSNHTEDQNFDNIRDAVEGGHGVITAHDAGTLWNDPSVNGGHAINTSGFRYNEDGEITHVITADTGQGGAADGQRAVPVDRYQDSLRDNYEINVTNDPVFR